MSPNTWVDTCIKHLRSFLNFQIINLKSVKKNLLKSYMYLTCIEYQHIASLKDQWIRFITPTHTERNKQ